MCWLLAGLCALALIDSSVANLPIKQYPRLHYVQVSSNVSIYCVHSKGVLSDDGIRWYKQDSHNDAEELDIQGGERIKMFSTNGTGVLSIRDLTLKDRGLYYCEIGDESGPGTELQVVRPLNCVKAQHRIKMKEALIVLQGLLLAVCVGAVLMRNHKLTQMEKNDSIYEEPETDHIYEGLTIETCGGGLYEELSIYAQAEGTEAPWE